MAKLMAKLRFKVQVAGQCESEFEWSPKPEVE